MIDDFDPSGLADRETVLARCTDWLGPVEVLAERSWPHGESRVLEVRTGAGKAIAKWSLRDYTYGLERRAYQRFVPALGELAPRLLRFDDGLRLLVVSRLPGEPVGPADVGRPEVHRQAGALFRRLHDSAPPRTDDGYAARLQTEVDGWVARGGLTGPEISAARALVTEVADVSVPLVPTHYDSGPRNWLIDGNTVRLIDFGWVDWRPWCADLVKLQRWPWLDRPDLQQAFLDGYGRTLDAAHARMLPALHVLSAVFIITWAHEHGMSEFEQSARDALAAAIT
jgi:hypothetical protein